MGRKKKGRAGSRLTPADQERALADAVRGAASYTTEMCAWVETLASAIRDVAASAEHSVHAREIMWIRIYGLLTEVLPALRRNEGTCRELDRALWMGAPKAIEPQVDQFLRWLASHVEVLRIAIDAVLRFEIPITEDEHLFIAHRRHRAAHFWPHFDRIVLTRDGQLQDHRDLHGMKISTERIQRACDGVLRAHHGNEASAAQDLAMRLRDPAEEVSEAIVAYATSKYDGPPFAPPPSSDP